MSGLVGNPNCWFSHAKAHIDCIALRPLSTAAAMLGW